MEAFERVTLWDRKYPGAKGGEEKTQHRQKTERSDKDESNEKKKTLYEKKHCFNCGLPDHIGKDCPTKENGPKCFKCGQRGHIAAKCGKTEVKASYVAVESNLSKCNKEVAINSHRVIALIDTGSDLCLMREDQYVEIGSPVLERKETRFRGVGSNENLAFGEFRAELTVDEHSYPVLIRVVSNNTFAHKFLIGTDFLNTIELCVKNGNVTIRPVEETVTDNSKLPEIFQIDLKNEKIDLTHILNNEHRSTIEDIVSNYCPVKTKETSVKMSIILKDEEPVYQRARRLSPQEKEYN